MVLGDVHDFTFKNSVGGGINHDTFIDKEIPGRMERGTDIEVESNKYKILSL